MSAEAGKIRSCAIYRAVLVSGGWEDSWLRDLSRRARWSSACGPPCRLWERRPDRGGGGPIGSPLRMDAGGGGGGAAGAINRAATPHRSPESALSSHHPLLTTDH